MAARQPISRVPDIDESEILRDPRFRAALAELAQAQGLARGETEKYAHKCLDELSVRPADRYLGWTAALARFIYTRGFEREFDVNTEALEALKELAKEHPLVFLWSHKSHLDGFVFMRALYDAGFRPQPLTFAGINMNFAGFGSLAKHSGAIFLRRQFRDDEVYKLVLKFYIDYLASKRVPLSWSIEGTRSRTGKLLPPRLGLIHWVMDAYKRAEINNAMFVPVAISFDQIPEMDDYIAMQHGLPKRKESLKWFLDYIGGMKAGFGKVYVRFGAPIALSEAVQASEIVTGGDEPSTHVQKVAFEVCSRIQHAIPIKCTDLVTLVLLAANGRALDAGEIQSQALDVRGLIERNRLPVAGDLSVEELDALQERLQALTANGLLRCYTGGRTPVYTITPGQQLAAAYYRNTIVQYFLNAAVAEIALAMIGCGAPGSEFDRVLIELRDLLKFEFFFKAKAEFRQDALEFLDQRYPGWRTTEGGFPDDPPPLFGQGILRSFVEAYAILARLLVSRGRQPISADNEAALIEGCLSRGQEMLLRREITTESAISQPLFETALRLARYRRLLVADEPDLAERRAQFAAEIDRTLAALDRLQRAYDSHLGEALPARH